MTNGQSIRFAVIVALFAGVITSQVVMVIQMTQPQPQQQSQQHVIHEQSVGMAIMWRTPQTAGMTPLDVLQSAAKRMQYEQGTELGNDRNAQAIIKVLDAIATLEGRQLVTEDGFPIIE
jgi:uncharacterized membrane protein YcjF (UPF0283 family)